MMTVLKGKLAALLQSKVGVAVLAALLVGGGGTVAALAATNGDLSKLPATLMGRGEVEVRGTVASVDTATSSFVMNTASGPVTVVVNLNTEFKEGLTGLGSLEAGTHVKVEGTRQRDGTILAREVEAENEVEVRGTVASVDLFGSSFVLNTATGPVTIVVNSTTEFQEGLTGLDSLKTGMQVEVEGTKQSDGTILALEVKAEIDVENEENEVELQGTVASVKMSNSSFVLNTATGPVTIVVNSRTEFQDNLSGLGSLQIGALVKVDGFKQSDGTILAERVEPQELIGVQQQIEVQGTVASVNLADSSFVLNTASGSVTVVVNGNTEFRNGLSGLASLQTGQSVKVDGTRQSNGTLLAARVELQEQQQVDVQGTVASVDTSTSSFVLNTSSGSVTVVVNGNTEFKDGLSGLNSLMVGMHVRARGSMQPNGTVLATEVDLT